MNLYISALTSLFSSWMVLTTIIPAIISVEAFSTRSSSSDHHHHRATSSFSNQQPPVLPKTKNPYAILGFDWLSPPNDFTVIQYAYKNLAKKYHPDIVLASTPNATPEERRAANLHFSRINQAYEIIKATWQRQEETFEVTLMGNGHTTKQYFTTITEEERRRDPHGINLQRIVDYRERFPNAKRKNWADGKYIHPPGGRHNGDFGPLVP